MFPVVDDYLAINDHVVDADGVVLWIAQNGIGPHLVGIEHDDVGLETVAEDAPVGQAEPLGRERGHLADRLGQAKLLLGPHELRQYDREAAV